MGKSKSTIWEYLAVGFNCLVLVISLLWIFTNRFSSYKKDLGEIEFLGISELVTYTLFLSGALGGAFYCLRSYYTWKAHMGNIEYDENNEPIGPVMNMKLWAFWYVFRPIQGGVLALILVFLAKANLTEISGDSGEVDFESFYLFIGLGFIAGFGAHEAMQKIEEVIRVVFAKSEGTTGKNPTPEQPTPKQPTPDPTKKDDPAKEEQEGQEEEKKEDKDPKKDDQADT